MDDDHQHHRVVLPVVQRTGAMALARRAWTDMIVMEAAGMDDAKGAGIGAAEEHPRRVGTPS